MNPDVQNDASFASLRKWIEATRSDSDSKAQIFSSPDSVTEDDQARCGSLWHVRCELSTLSKGLRSQPTDLCESIDRSMDML